MRRFQLDEFVVASGGFALSKKKTDFMGLGTDSRKDLTDFIFIALKGENFDGHHFLEAAVEAGASCLVIERQYINSYPDLVNKLAQKVTVVEVVDTLLALQKVGNYCRRETQVKVIGITGSNGKTTSKEFTAQLLSRFRKVHFSQGSFNNHWGVPFTLIQIPKDCDVVIVEMGMNHPGEIRDLVKIAEPDIVACTMVGMAHIEFFGHIEKIADAKEEIYIHSSPTATRIYNLDNEYTRKMQSRGNLSYPNSRQITVSSLNPKADIYLHAVDEDIGKLTLGGSIAETMGRVTVPIFGIHNLTNLLIAAASAWAVGLSPNEIWQGLELCKTNWGRNQFVSLKSGATAIFDAYNANPDSMGVLLANIKRLSVKKMNSSRKLYGIFGEMLELGDLSKDSHFKLGQMAAEVEFDHVYFVGSEASGASFKEGLVNSGYKNNIVISNTYNESLAKQLSSMLNRSDLVILKGSRGMKLERFLLACEPLNFNLNKESTI